MIWVMTKGAVDETGDGSIGACDVVVRRRGVLARQTGLCLHGDTRPGRNSPRRTLHAGRGISPEQAWRAGEVFAGEELSRCRDRVHQRPGAIGLVRRLHRRAGPPPGAGLGGDRAGRRRRGIQVVHYRQHQDRPHAIQGVSEGDRGQIVHLRLARLDLLSPDAGVFHPQRVRARSRRSLYARRLLRRPQPDDPAGAVRRLRDRRPRLHGLGPRQEGRQDRFRAGGRDLGVADLPRLSMDRARRRRSGVRRRLQGQAHRGAAGGRRSRHPRTVCPLEIHSRQERRLRPDRGGRQGDQTSQLRSLRVSALVELRKASAGYGGVPVLHDIDLTINIGERVAVMGRSGAGKSTLLNLLHARLGDKVALIPQAAALVKTLSVFHNVYMGRLDRHSTLHNLRNLAWPARRDIAEVEDTLELVGLADKLFEQAGTLSGGQQQRASVARALYNDRAILIGDEPVSALDRRQGADILGKLCARHDTAIFAMHDISLALAHADRVVVIEEGRIVLDAPSRTIAAVDLVPYYGG